MREVVILIPTLEAEQNVDIDVRINGKKRTMKYRVEIVGWQGEEPSPEAKVELIRRVIADKVEDWELIQIGAPRTDSIPILFRKKGETSLIGIAES